MPIPLLLFVLAGTGLWIRDAVHLLRWRATPAVVAASTIEVGRSTKGQRTYAPDVAYRYTVGGAPYTSHSVLATRRSGDEDWARALAARFPAGASITAYVDPSDPTSAFLVRRPNSALYLAIIAPLAVLVVLATMSDGTHPVPPPAPVRGAGANDWIVLPLESTADRARRRTRFDRRWRLAAAGLLVAYLSVAIVCASGAPGSIAALRESTFGDGFFVFEIVVMAGVTWLLARQRRRAEAMARLGDPLVTLDVAAVRVGDRVTLHVVMPGALRAGAPSIDRLLVGLQRDTAVGRGTTKPSPEHVETWAAVVGEAVRSQPAPSNGAALVAAAPGLATAPQSGYATFDLPVTAPPSSLDASARPFTTWTVGVRISIAGGGDVELQYPLRIDAARA